MPSQRLLVSVRGPNEAVQAAKGGAQIADAEYPASALGTTYPLNITANNEAREVTHKLQWRRRQSRGRADGEARAGF